MTDETKNKFVLPFPLLTLVAGIYIAFWSKLYLNFYLNTDFGWLFTCLQRYLAGGTYATDFYETNPPLSFLLYLPAYLLYSTLGVFPSIGILIYFAIINVLVAVIILKYMRLYDFPATMKAGVIFSLIFVTTWLTNASYGQKDHLIFLLFLPYTLMHVGIIASRTIPKNLIIITSILGGLAVCIKPHYLLIPATFYLYRLVANRNLLKIILSIDFVAFVLTGLVYLAFIYMCFPDYFNIILPEVLEYYGEDKPLPVTPHLSFMVLSVTAFLILLFVQETEQTKFLRLTVFALIGLSILSAIAYYAQNKGFYYHTIPFFGYAAMAFILALFGLIYYSSRILEASIIVPVVVIFLITHTFMTGFPPGFLSTKEFRDLPYHKKIEELAKNGRYIDLEMKSNMLGLPYYYKLSNVMRFGQIWPILGLKYKFESTTNEKDREVIRKKMHHFIDMIADDIKNKKPSLLIIPRYTETGEPEPSQSYYNFFMKNDNFKKNMQNYNFVETFIYDGGQYTRGEQSKPEKKMRTVDLFTLKDDSHEQNRTQENE